MTKSLENAILNGIKAGANVVSTLKTTNIVTITVDATSAYALVMRNIDGVQTEQRYEKVTTFNAINDAIEAAELEKIKEFNLHHFIICVVGFEAKQNPGARIIVDGIPHWDFKVKNYVDNLVDGKFDFDKFQKGMRQANKTDKQILAAVTTMEESLTVLNVFGQTLANCRYKSGDVYKYYIATDKKGKRLDKFSGSAIVRDGQLYQQQQQEDDLVFGDDEEDGDNLVQVGFVKAARDGEYEFHNGFTDKIFVYTENEEQRTVSYRSLLRDHLKPNSDGVYDVVGLPNQRPTNLQIAIQLAVSHAKLATTYADYGNTVGCADF